MCKVIKVQTIWINMLKEALYKRSWLKSMPLRGLLKNIGDNRLPYSVYVNNWPDFNTVLAVPSATLPVHRLGVYSEDVGVLEDMLCLPNLLPPAPAVIRVMAASTDLLPAFQNTASRLGMEATFIGKEDPRHFIVFNLTGHEEYATNIANSLPDEYYYAPLNAEKDLDTIIPQWKELNWDEFYANDQEGILATKFFIQHCVPSLGVYRKSDHKLVSWVLSDVETTAMMDYTHPDHRKTIVTNCRKVEYARRKLRLGEYYWGSIARSNKRSWMSFARYGECVTTHPETDLFHCVMRHSRIPPDLYYSPLNPDKDSNIMADHWKQHNWALFFTNDHEGLKEMRFSMKNFGQTLGVYQKSNHRLVSWLFSDADSAARMMYTIPEYRKSLVTDCIRMRWGLSRFQFDAKTVYWGVVPSAHERNRRSFDRHRGIFDIRTEEDLFHSNLRWL